MDKMLGPNGVRYREVLLYTCLCCEIGGGGGGGGHMTMNNFFQKYSEVMHF